MKSDITIVIPVFNRAHTLPRTLASVERQTMLPDEVILVDNNSADSSMEVMTAWRDKMAQGGLKVTVPSETAPGAAAARNKGLSL
nr:glycosyltransferase family 2 protein [Duncaniella sp.]